MNLFPGLLERVAPPPTPTTPIIKWVGGKTRLMNEIVARVPPTYGRYFEPFAGGAALFFRLAPDRAVLNDANEDLIAMYGMLAAAPELVIRRLAEHKLAHSKEHYYAMRAAWNAGIDNDYVGRAAAFIYLNKTCFNGLWRVNKAGEFNVPMGKYTNPQIFDADALHSASRALTRATLRTGDFAAAVMDAGRGDFVYFDPPYHETFTAYTGDSFNEIQQRRLARLARELVGRGVHVLLSNNDTPLIRELYADFRVDVVTCSRPINSDRAGRAPVNELLIAAGPH